MNLLVKTVVLCLYDYSAMSYQPPVDVVGRGRHWLYNFFLFMTILRWNFSAVGIEEIKIYDTFHTICTRTTIAEF